MAMMTMSEAREAAQAQANETGFVMVVVAAPRNPDMFIVINESAASDSNVVARYVPEVEDNTPPAPASNHPALTAVAAHLRGRGWQSDDEACLTFLAEQVRMIANQQRKYNTRLQRAQVILAGYGEGYSMSTAERADFYGSERDYIKSLMK